MIVGAVTGACTTTCVYDEEGACLNCRALDPDRFWVVELPTKEQAERAAAVDAFRKTAEQLGLDPAILQVRSGLGDAG